MSERLRMPLRRLREAAWPVAQAAVAAGIAWFVADTVLGHVVPVFAPVAAVIALAANVGGRGRQAVQMLLGVVVGVAVGELLVLVLGTGALQIVLVAAVAMLIAAALDYSPLPLIQAGASAVIVVALQSPESGGERLIDALVGGGIALLVSQGLSSPNPASLLTGAARRALEPIAAGLREVADALAEGDPLDTSAALERLRGARVPLADMEATLSTGRQIARLTPRGRWSANRLQRLDERLQNIDLLLPSALMLARTADRLPDERVAMAGWLCEAVGELARGTEALAEDPESEQARSRALSLARQAGQSASDGEGDWACPAEDAAARAVRWVAADLARLAASSEAEPLPER